MTLLPSDVRKAMYVVDTNGAADLLQTALGFAPQGRKSALTPRLFLIGAILSVQSRRHIVMEEIFRTLVEDIDLDLQIELGVVKQRTGKLLISKKAMERFSSRLSERLEYGRGSAPDLNEVERERRRVAVMDVIDALLAPTLPARKFAAYALDTSGIWAWGRAPGKAPSDLLAKDALIREQGTDEGIEESDLLSSLCGEAVESEVGKEETDLVKVSEPYERDGRWGIKTSKEGERESVFGFDLHALVRVPDMDGDASLEANLVEAMDVTPASQDIVAPSLRLIDRLRASGQTVQELLTDRHYSYKQADRWAFQLLKRGIEQVVDLHQNDQGFRDYNGAKLAAATLHCPGTPTFLGVIKNPAPAGTREQMNTFNHLIETRWQYAFQRITTQGRRRYKCPALAGKVGCPLRAGTVEAARTGNRLVIINPPAAATAPTCCTQDTVELKEDGQPKLWQKEYWGSRRWQKSYNRRTYVEGAFGNLKNASGENVSRGFFRVSGQARVTLLLGIAVTAHNMRQVRNWHERTGNGDPSHPLFAADSTTLQVHMTLEEYEILQIIRNLGRELEAPMEDTADGGFGEAA